MIIHSYLFDNGVDSDISMEGREGEGEIIVTAAVVQWGWVEWKRDQ